MTSNAMIVLTVVFALFVALSTTSAFVSTGISSVCRRNCVLSMSRVPLVAGNWKMNTDLVSAVSLATELVFATKDVDPLKVEIALLPPFPFLRDVMKAVEGSNIKVGAQTAYFEAKGAFTGAISPAMLSSVGCQYCLAGHSERRKLFREFDNEINHIIEKLQESNITPILCIGETKEDYELGLNEQVCTIQLARDLKGLTPEQVSKLVIAYEPVWAIGTGLSATPEIAQGVHFAVRKWLRKAYGNDVAEMIRIQYGGSVTADNVDILMKCPDIDGALVGGASLTAASFARIAKFNP